MKQIDYPKNIIKLLNKISVVVKEENTSEEYYKKILKALNGVIVYESATLLLFNENNKNLEIVAQIGEELNLADGFSFGGIGGGFAAWVATQKETKVFPYIHSKNASMIFSPLIIHGSLLGVLAIAHSKQNKYSKDMIPLVDVAANQITAVIEWIFMMKKVRDQNQKLESKVNELDSKQRELEHVIEELEIAQHKAVENERLRAVTETVIALNHQINNPLAALSGRVQMLLSDNSLEPSYKKHLEIINEQSKIIGEKVEKMQHITKLKTTKYATGETMVDIDNSE